MRANGLEFHVARAGAGDPVVMLHGWPQHWYMWRHQVPRLAGRYAVFCPDLRGFGWSEAPRHGYAKETLADDVLALLDELGLDRIRLVGHDWGAWIGFLICLRAPARVLQFVALNTPHPFQKLSFRHAHLWRFWYQLVIACPLLGYFLLKNRPRLLRRLLRAWSARSWSVEDLDIYSGRIRQPARARATVSLYRTFLLREILPILGGRYTRARLTTPTLILHGTGDVVISPTLLHGYEAHAADMNVELVPNAGHFIAEDQPDFVTDRILAFFESGSNVPRRATSSSPAPPD